jgi:hypothetical protein
MIKSDRSGIKTAPIGAHSEDKRPAPSCARWHLSRRKYRWTMLNLVCAPLIFVGNTLYSLAGRGLGLKYSGVFDEKAKTWLSMAT